MIGKIAKTLKRISPVFLYNGFRVVYRRLKPMIKLLHAIYLKIKLKKVQANHKKALEKVRKKEKIKVVFFALFDAVWKYDDLYRLMEKHPRFEPVILVCPVVNYGNENMLEKMDSCYKLLIEKKFNVIRSYNKDNDTYVDVNKEIQPDIIFYTNPYKGLIHNKYYITEYQNTLTCYVPYSFVLFEDKWAFNQPVQNLCWRVFYPHEVYKGITEKLNDNNKNVRITGYPTYDRFYCNKRQIIPNIWKTNNKKIIWAPHHTIGDSYGFSFSNFLCLHEVIFEIAEKFKNQIEIAFKPHPLLKDRLYLHKDWGKEKTNAYYRKWDELPNGIKAEGDYVDLFMSSDAMIHDSGSFIVEYHYTLKPVMFFTNDSQYNELFIVLGREALDAHYKGNTRNDIELFIENVVLQNKDIMYATRKTFFDNYLVPPHGKCVAENIIAEINNTL